VAAKHGVLGLIKTVALEGAEFGITANAICPGYVETPLVSGQIADTAKARNMSEEEVINEVILKAQPTKQFVQVGQIAALAQLPRLGPGSADHRRSAADGRRMDSAMSVRKPA
jgi:3-hydroxybutyrate dehydrogenase